MIFRVGDAVIAKEDYFNGYIKIVHKGEECIVSGASSLLNYIELYGKLNPATGLSWMFNEPLDAFILKNPLHSIIKRITIQ